MQSNPVIEEQQRAVREAREKEAFRHNFIVTFVVAAIEDIPREPSFRIVKRFCDENHVAFSAREYNTVKYDEDCHYIAKLPAFHIYGKKHRELWNTTYPDDNPIQKIQDEIVRWRREQEKKRARKEAWEKKVSGLIAFFEGLTKKKTALKQPLPPKKKAAVAAIPLEYIDKAPFAAAVPNMPLK